MSDNMVVYLGLDADEAEAERRVDAIIDWLLDIEIIAPAAVPDSFYGQYREGRRFVEAFDLSWLPPEAAGGTYPPGFGVEVVKGWHISHNMDGFEPPPCPKCGTHLPDPEMGDLMLEWHESRTEPRVTCADCAHSDLLGNWPHVFAGYGNYGSVSFIDAFPLTDEFDREILSRLGGRPRKLYVHI